VVPARGKWIPLVSIGVAYAGFVAGLWVMALLSTPEYEHASYLHDGLVWLAWSLLALLTSAVSVASLRRSSAQLPRSLRRMTAALNIVVVIVLVGALPFSIWSLADYRAGIAAYDAAVQRCGHPPVLASAGYWGDVLLPTDSDYERLKYSTVDPLLLGAPIYFCTLADAEAHGYQRQSWHDEVPLSEIVAAAGAGR
jgi:hypothetical protein